MAVGTDQSWPPDDDFSQKPSPPNPDDETCTLAQDGGSLTLPGLTAAGTLAAGTRLGPYRILEQIGSGGMGVVYSAVDTRIDRRLALKVMQPKYAALPAAKERLLREARAAAGINHDNVLTIYEADEHQGVPYIAMPFLRGCPLDEYLKHKGCPSLSKVLRITRETAAGLAAAHAVGLIHRDIKPSNLWLEDPSGRVKVFDFGLARPLVTDAELTQYGAVVGTPSYMAPEQARSERIDHRADLFSLGAVLYRLCSGQVPFQGENTLAILFAVTTHELPPVRQINPAVPEPLSELIQALMAKDPAQRPQTADEVVRQVRAIAATLAPSRNSDPLMPVIDLSDSALTPASGLTSAATHAAQPVANRSPWLWVAAGVAGLATAGSLALLNASSQNAGKTGNSPNTSSNAASGEHSAAGTTPSPVVSTRPPRRTGANSIVPAGADALLPANAVAGATAAGPANSVVPADGTAPDATAPDATAPDATAPSANTADADAAAYVLSVGGTIRINGQRQDVTDAKELPAGSFNLMAVLLDANGRVTDAGLAVFDTCQNVAELSIWRTSISDAGLAHFRNCLGFTLLELGESQVSAEVLEAFKECDGLRELKLFYTPTTDATLAHLAHFPKLTLLDLDGTAVTDAGVEHIKGCRKLRFLGIKHTQISDAGLALLHEVSTLTYLDARNSKVTPEGLAAFHAAVPRCRIDTDEGIIAAE